MKNLALVFVLTLTSTLSHAAIENLEMEPTHGKIQFTAKGKPALITIQGKSPGPEGKLTESGGKVSGNLTLDLNRLKTGISLRDDHMKSKYLETQKYPNAVLTLIDFDLATSAEERPFQATLLLHGVEKPVSGIAVVYQREGVKHIEAEMQIRLSDFGIDIPSYQQITVAEDVKIHVQTALSPIPQTAK